MHTKPVMTEKDLVDFGFSKIGEWTFSDRYTSVGHLLDAGWEGIAFTIPTELHQERNVVYAFLAENEVLYVGETTRGMKSRFEGYRYGNNKDTDTDNTVKISITKKLRYGVGVTIWFKQPVATLKLPSHSMEVPASKPFEEFLIGEYHLPDNKKNLNATNKKG